MGQPANRGIAEIIKAAQDAAGKKATGAEAAELKRFIAQLYANSPPDDLKARTPDDLANAAGRLWSALQSRAPQRSIVRVTAGDQAGAPGRTVVEIVTDDMPFLVDSVTAELERIEEPAQLVIHPIVTVERDAAGKLKRLCEPDDSGGANESVMHIEIGELADSDMAERITDTVTSVLGDVRLAVRDWQAMRRAAGRLAAEFDGPSPGIDAEQAAEIGDFLRWLHDDHYTFLGYRRLGLDTAGGKRVLRIAQAESLGVLTKAQINIFDGLADGAPVPAQFDAFLTGAASLLIVKANQRATVHRRVHYDVVAVKIFNDQGKVTGVHLFAGLFTADVYTNSPSFVPVLRRKIDRIRARVGFRKHSHDGKRLQNIMENLPRDELFESSDDQLLEVGLGLLHLQERARTAVFVRTDRFERFVSCLVYVPRDRYDTQLRLAVGDILTKAFDGRLSSYFTQVTDAALARIHFIIATRPGKLPAVDMKALEARIARASRAWSDDLREAFVARHGEAEGARLANLFAHAFPPGYRHAFVAEDGVADARFVLACLDQKKVGIRVYRPQAVKDGNPESAVGIKLYSIGATLALSEMIPIFENMGFKVLSENPHQITPTGAGGGTQGRASVWLHDFQMTVAGGGAFDIERFAAPVEEAFDKVWSGEMESDGFNRLVAFTGFPWREVTILRAYAKYLRQVAFPFSQSYIETAIAAHAGIARKLADLFLLSFDPGLNTGAKAKATAKKVEDLRAAIAADLDGVTNADEDRILRRYLNLIDCSLRTNYFQKDANGAHKPYLSIKLDSRRIEDLPLPRMNVEVFVYSPRMEGIHLRGGKVARGGIRWSDRREDFRAEILGLVKAQMVKNAVIVPTGSKGGFVVKNPPPPALGREAVQKEGIACYQYLQRGLLDITDNVIDNQIVPPASVVRKDADDPYLVVAADKGTATFSDIANAVSADYKFWLGDAYASGGSAGYDHKVMGITARGAWECVKRHFREMNVDCQAQDFTCAGVGDMSGDVFGNGMLLSKHIRLKAAFNHLHIFIDPEPDAAKSWAERDRMFKLPRSSWTDYDAKLISKGGGVFERSAKSIKLSPEIKAMLGLTKAEASPTEIMNAILRMPVDLMFFGGIGTFVKSAAESHADVSDKANDAIRINGAELRAKVIGEGANLGMTQRGRIEAAMKGVRLNTDAIDNSAGVDCSDHEVNIKILLNGLMQTGKLTLPNRNKLLAEMTDEVAELVLRDNYQQSQTISLLERRATELLDAQNRTMKVFERDGLLNRAIEYLPDDEELAERIAAGKGLTRPEIAVFLPYGKMWLYERLIASDLPDDPVSEEDLFAYFPKPIQKKYPDAVRKHKLRREIVATGVTNSFVNRVGPQFLTTLMDRSGLGPVDVARAYIVTRIAYGLREVWRKIEALDAKVPADVQSDMFIEINRMIERSALWLLRNVPAPMDISATVAKLKPVVDVFKKDYRGMWSDEVAGYVNRAADAYKAKGVPADTALDVALLFRIAAANDVWRLSEALKQPVPQVARMYFLVGQRFGMGDLRRSTEDLARTSHWERLAVSAAVEELYAHQTKLTQLILTLGKARKLAGDKAIEAWAAANKAPVDRFDQVLGEIRGAETVSLAMLTVANRQLSALSAG
ncbi:MAG: NAD-glutamate dehydrogenase [Rhodospirillaceae bacterium]|nr:NAD-glutamate dehydrogenase [Rhodospirillaceae bacterium]